MSFRLNMTTQLRFSRAGDPPRPFSAGPTVWLEIQRGRTLYPRRPVLTERFLIGAGSNCHLQLGGDGMPFLHSLLTVEGGGVFIEAFVPWPELCVNGETLRTAHLADGDEITIGPFQFTVHLRASAEVEPDQSLYAAIPPEAAREGSEPEDVSALSTAELVGRIEALECEVEAHERAERRGAAALLDAARHAAVVAPPDARPDEGETAALLRDFSDLSQDLEHRLTLLREREQEQMSRAEALLTAQARLAEQLQLAAQSLAAEEARIRASA
jgi:hypothetical protein